MSLSQEPVLVGSAPRSRPRSGHLRPQRLLPHPETGGGLLGLPSIELATAFLAAVRAEWVAESLARCERGGAHGGVRLPPCHGRHSSSLPRVSSVFPGSCLLSDHSLPRMCWLRSRGTGEGPRVDAGVTLATLRPPRGFCRVVGFFPSPPVWCIFKQILFFKEDFS